MTKGDRDAGRDGEAIVPDSPEKRSFVQGLLDRGEAVRAEAGKPLPSNATHVIVGDDEVDGLPVVKRVRFRAY